MYAKVVLIDRKNVFLQATTKERIKKFVDGENEQREREDNVSLVRITMLKKGNK